MIKKIDLENHFYDISSVEALQSRAKGDYPYWDKETNSKNRIGKRVKELRIQKKLSSLIRVTWQM